MKINKVAHPREHRGNHKGLPFHGKPHVADKAFIQNLVNRFAVVRPAMRLADHARPLGRREGFGHRAPLRETWRGVDRFAVTRHFFSRRHSGMSGEQLQNPNMTASPGGAPLSSSKIKYAANLVSAAACRKRALQPKARM